MGIKPLVESLSSGLALFAKILLALPTLAHGSLVSFAPIVLHRFLFLKYIFKFIAELLNDVVVLLYQAILGDVPPGVSRQPKILPALLGSPKIIVGLPFVGGSFTTILLTMASLLGIGITAILGVASIGGITGSLIGSFSAMTMPMRSFRGLLKTLLPILTLSLIRRFSKALCVGFVGSLLTSIPGSILLTVLSLLVLFIGTLVSFALAIISGMVLPYEIKEFYDSTVKTALSTITNIAKSPIDLLLRASTWIIAGIFLVLIPPLNIIGIPIILVYLLLSPLLLINVSYRWLAPTIKATGYLLVALTTASIFLCVLTLDVVFLTTTLCAGWLYPMLWTCIGFIGTLLIALTINILRNVRTSAYKLAVYSPLLFLPLFPIFLPISCVGIFLALIRFTTGLCLAGLSAVVALFSVVLACLSLPPTCLGLFVDAPVIFFDAIFVFLMLIISQSVPSDVLFGESEAVIEDLWDTLLEKLASAYAVGSKIIVIPRLAMSFVGNPAQSVGTCINIVGSTFEFLFDVVETPAQKLLAYVGT